MDLNVSNQLAKTACPSIRYRIKKELLGEDITSPEMKGLQEAILQDPEVRRILALQKEDGWLGGTFHGVDEPECGIRYLMEKGVEPCHPAVQKALQAILDRGEAFAKGSMERVGKPLDAWHLGGSKLMRAAVFAYAGAEEQDFVKAGIREALDVFRFASGVSDTQDLYEPYKGKKVFRQGVVWPCTYHLRLLAFTKGWRTAENEAMLVKAAARLAALSPIPEIKLLHKGQVIGPAAMYMLNFSDDMDSLSDAGWMMWFHRMEMLARLGVVSQVEVLRHQAEYVANRMKENGNLFTKPLRHPYFTKWSQYMGLALESDWKTNGRRVNDLTFRWLMIAYYGSIDIYQ